MSFSKQIPCKKTPRKVTGCLRVTEKAATNLTNFLKPEIKTGIDAHGKRLKVSRGI
ncbi:hypothetical protein SAMN06265375_101615 [Muriicola jejuensis]|nr:hypothetical protein SAMN06265375_101615 [Muriicola jejuensis]